MSKYEKLWEAVSKRNEENLKLTYEEIEKLAGTNIISAKGSVPADDGYYMPAEFHKQKGCILIWPQRPGSWPYGAKEARKAFANIIREIAKSEMVYVAVSQNALASAKEYLEGISNLEFYIYETDDAWARDVAPTFLIPRDRSKKELRCVNWEFNAWGGEYNGLYANWDKDNAFALEFTKEYQVPCYDARPFVLEGGSIHSDGEGTILVTETCLLSKGRNPQLTKLEIEENLKKWLGAEKVLWIPYGIYNDETDEHVDNVCAFIRPAEVVLAWTDREDDPQYAMSMADYEYLSQQTDAKGRKITIHKLPIPKNPILICEEDLLGYTFEEGEDTREVGERLAASYVNFYFTNDSVLVPAFGGENAESDLLAKDILQRLCQERTVKLIDAKAILLGGGNIHCITQQIPAVEAD